VIQGDCRPCSDLGLVQFGAQRAPQPSKLVIKLRAPRMHQRTANDGHRRAPAVNLRSRPLTIAVGRQAHRTPGHRPAEDSKIKAADSSHPLVQHSAVFLGYRLSSSRPPRQGRPSGPSLRDCYATLDPATTHRVAPTRKKGRKQGLG
jgi:hypothetical protein